MSGKPGPLAGIRLIEMDAIGPVPLASMILADMGADVLRIARPSSAASAWDDVGGVILHRSRASAVADMKNPDDIAQILRLVEKADGLLEGFRPGVMERLGLGPDVCLKHNPKFVYGRMTGWGQAGPLALRAGHDINYLSLTGGLHAIGTPDEPPPPPLNFVADYGGGAMFLVSGLLAAILSAKNTGKGQVVDVSMTDGVATLMSMFYAYKSTGMWVDERFNNLLDGAAPFYRCYECADGKYVAAGPIEPQFFVQMVAGLGLQDRKYNQMDKAAWPAMSEEFEAAFKTRTRDEWAEIFKDTDACVTPVLNMTEAPRGAHIAARQGFVTDGGLDQPAPAPRFSGTPSAISAQTKVALADVIAAWK